MKRENTIEGNQAVSPEILPLGGAACEGCEGCGMTTGLEPNDDIMNTPCPECNPWAEKRLLLDNHDRYRPAPESDATIQIACAPINGRATDEDAQRFGIIVRIALRNMQRERDALQRQVWSLEEEISAIKASPANV
jgi:hypothetical protein